MGKIKSLSLFLCIILVSLNLWAIIYNACQDTDRIERQSVGLRILNRNEYECLYEFKSDNILICDLNTVSRISWNMKDDGFSYKELEQSSEVLDFIMEREDLSVRFRYEDGCLIFITSPYEKSSIPLSYLEER